MSDGVLGSEENIEVLCDDDFISDEKQKARQFSLLILSLYKDHPELWNPKCDGFSNKFMRRKALKEITEALKQYKPDFTERLLRIKINSLRSNFNKELRKREQRRRSGNYVEHPDIWYYDAMMFLKDESHVKTAKETSEGGLYMIKPCLEPKKRKLTRMTEYDEESILYEQPESCPEEPGSKVEMLDEFDTSDEPYPVEAESEPEIDYENDPLIAHQKSHIKIYQSVTEHDAVGVNVAKKLAKMNPDQAIYAESIINTALRRGLLLKLTDDTDLCDKGCNQVQYKYTLDKRMLLKRLKK